MIQTPLHGIRATGFAYILTALRAGRPVVYIGADIIKAESPEGDDTRKWGPPLVTGDGTHTRQIHAELEHAKP